MRRERIEDHIEAVLYSEEAIQRRVGELADEIASDYVDRDFAKDTEDRPILLVGILRGALVFMSDLARRFPMPVEYDLISVSSYGNGTAPGAVRLVKDLEKPIGGRDVLIVEDIIDTGFTIEYLKRSFAARNAASVRVCSLVDKIVRREKPVDIDYVGFTLEEDAFVVGYGMDYAELYRNLPFIGILKPDFIG
jgi:hypoxanthine phosphoribosyltransferase